MEKKHLLILGDRNSGKTELILELLSHSTRPVYGFYTYSDQPDSSGRHNIYIRSARCPGTPMSPANHIGSCNGRQRSVNSRIFETLGIEYLKSRPEGIILMDELGFMEASSPKFCSAVLSCLEGDTPVLAAVKNHRGTQFLECVINHPKAAVYPIELCSREDIHRMLLAQVESWN